MLGTSDFYSVEVHNLLYSGPCLSVWLIMQLLHINAMQMVGVSLNGAFKECPRILDVFHSVALLGFVWTRPSDVLSVAVGAIPLTNGR